MLLCSIFIIYVPEYSKNLVTRWLQSQEILCNKMNRCFCCFLCTLILWIENLQYLKKLWPIDYADYEYALQLFLLNRENVKICDRLWRCAVLCLPAATQHSRPPAGPASQTRQHGTPGLHHEITGEQSYDLYMTQMLCLKLL